MRIEIELSGKTRDVTVVKSGTPGRLYVSWDGTTHEVDARIIEHDRHGALFSLVQIDNDARCLEFRCGDVDRTGSMSIDINGVVFDAVINGSRARIDTGAVGGADVGTFRLKAPMSGKVVRVLVSPGDEVEVRQPLVVVEAMKMENELTAARAGTVAEVPVSEGVLVETGCLLVVIK